MKKRERVTTMKLTTTMAGSHLNAGKQFLIPNASQKSKRNPTSIG